MTTRTASNSGDTQLDRTLLQAMRYGQLAAYHERNAGDATVMIAMREYVCQFTKDIQAAIWGAFWHAYHQVWCCAEARALVG